MMDHGGIDKWMHLPQNEQKASAEEHLWAFMSYDSLLRAVSMFRSVSLCVYIQVLGVSPALLAMWLFHP